MARIIGKTFNNFNSGVEQANGDWRVEVILVETFLHDDGTTKEEKIEVVCIDSDFQVAHQVALASALNQYREETIDRGMVSLIESREKYGNPNDNSGNNKDTITQ